MLFSSTEKEPQHTVLSRHETPINSSVNGNLVMIFELCQPTPAGLAYISFKLLQTRRDGTLHVCNHQLVNFSNEEATTAAFARVLAGTSGEWTDMGATEIETLERKPPLHKFEVT
jgi:hypothetical protein